MERYDVEQVSVPALGALSAGSLSWAAGWDGAELLVFFSYSCVWVAGECGWDIAVLGVLWA